MKKTEEYKKFDAMMDKVLSVPHSEIKAKLDAEKEEKRKRKRAKKPISRAASRDSGGDT